MKGFLIIAICVVVVSAGGDFKEMMKQCIEKEFGEGVQKDEIMQSWKNFSEDSEVDPKFKCYLACTMESMRTMTPDGFNSEPFLNGMKQKLDGDENKLSKLKSAFDECVGQVKSQERCERAFEFSKCMMPKFKGLGIKFTKNAQN